MGAKYGPLCHGTSQTTGGRGYTGMSVCYGPGGRMTTWPGDNSGMASECLVVEALVWDRPVQVLRGERLPLVATVVGDPTSVLKAPLSSYDRDLVRQ